MFDALRRARWFALSLSILLVACGGEDDDGGQQSVNAVATGQNAPPTISGDPGASVAQGAAYSFTPTWTDAEGDAVVFGIDARPPWAAFDTATGQLSGTPTASDVGTYPGIVISVTDGRNQALLPAFTVTVTASAAANRAPTISGKAPGSATAGVTYTFEPVAADPDGDALTFTIRNRPSWASFDGKTGVLEGVPLIANVGTFANVTISVSDGKSTVSLTPFTIAVAAPTSNTRPTISGSPATTVEAGSAYSFVPSADDADGDALTFSIAGKPAWATFDMQTGALTGTPPSGTTGTAANIVITVSDGAAGASLAAFAITVTAPTTNQAPTISGSPATTATQGKAYSFQPTAADADGDTLTFTIANRPTWATFNTNTGRLSGTPGSTNIRTYGNIVISVRDGKASAALPAFSIAVASANTAPSISGTPAATATVGTAYTFTPTASDAESTTLTFSIANKPSWASFSTTTGRLQGTPAAANVGTFAGIAITVSDGQDSSNLAPFSIAVKAANRAPTISGSPTVSVLSGTAYSFQPTAADPDGDTLTFSITNKPAWATFSTTTGRLQGTPSAGAVGTTAGVVISVSDGTAKASLTAFDLAVQAVATGSATLSWTPPTTNTDGSQLGDLAGYKIYWGTSQGSYPNSATVKNSGVATYVVTDLLPGTWYFVVTSFNADGVESAQSNVGSQTVL
jgi:hypothetical protein